MPFSQDVQHREGDIYICIIRAQKMLGNLLTAECTGFNVHYYSRMNGLENHHPIVFQREKKEETLAIVQSLLGQVWRVSGA